MPKRRRAPGEFPARDRIQEGFGERLKAARGNTPQTVLAEALGVTRSSISNIENGRHRVFLDQVYAAARTLDVDLATLLPPLNAVSDSPAIHSSGIPSSHHPELIRVAEKVLKKGATRSR